MTASLLSPRPMVAALIATITLSAPLALAQSERPAAAAPERTTITPVADDDDPVERSSGDVRPLTLEVEPAVPNGNGPARRPARDVGDELVSITWNDEEVRDTFAFIAEYTGKVVIPVNLMSMSNKKFTLITSRPVPHSRALDLLFDALRHNGVHIIESEDVVVIGATDQVGVAVAEYPIVGPDETLMHRTDVGSLIVKFIPLENVPAEGVLEQITAKDPPSSFTITADANSNQLVVWGDVGYCRHIEELASRLDRKYVEAVTKTFRLRYADAEDVATNILDLFEEDGASSSGNQQRRTPTRNRGRGQAQSPNEAANIGPDIELRVTVNTQQNSVTIAGDPHTARMIETLIESEWDLPRSTGTSRVYQLIYTDPIKVADKINSLLGQGTGGTSGSGRQGARGAGANGGGDASQILSGIYQIESFPDSNQLLVFAKTEESLDFLSQLIEKIDQPTPIGLPFVVELKHANAIELAQQLNALLAEPGAGATIDAPPTGLSGGNTGELGEGTDGQDQAGTLDFPWQRGGRQRDDVTPESSLIGRVRIVPIVRQNALAILCPKPQEDAVEELVSYFDRPGRQVMISVILAEVELSNNLSLGLRLSSSDAIASAANPDNFLSGSITSSGSEENPWSKIFDTSVLDLNVDLNVVLQALDQDNNLRVLQQPVIFTADNQEAFFFDGQEIPFITNTTINSQGNPTDSFDYRNVGLVLNARPRITQTHDVDLELSLELSAVVPGQTLFGGAIIDRRTTTTHVVVENGQTIVLSGILRESESQVERGVPFLSDIPLIGELFKSRDYENVTSELVAFITPMVVDSPDENDHNFMQDRRNELERLISPLAEQKEYLKENPESIRERMRPGRLDLDSVRGHGVNSRENYSAETTNLEDLHMEKVRREGEAKREELDAVLDANSSSTASNEDDG